MKLVFTHAEIADALAMSMDEFDQSRPAMEELGFPRPVRGLGNRWSIMEVMHWINHGDGASMMAAHMLADEDNDMTDRSNMSSSSASGNIHIFRRPLHDL